MTRVTLHLRDGYARSPVDPGMDIIVGAALADLVDIGGDELPGADGAVLGLPVGQVRLEADGQLSARPSRAVTTVPAAGASTGRSQAK